MTQRRFDRTFYSTVHFCPGAEGDLSLFTYRVGDPIPILGGPSVTATKLDTNTPDAVPGAGCFPAYDTFIVEAVEARVVEGHSDPEIEAALKQIGLRLHAGGCVADECTVSVCTTPRPIKPVLIPPRMGYSVRLSFPPCLPLTTRLVLRVLLHGSYRQNP